MQIECEKCGAPLTVDGKTKIVKCEFCKSTFHFADLDENVATAAQEDSLDLTHHSSSEYPESNQANANRVESHEGQDGIFVVLLLGVAVFIFFAAVSQSMAVIGVAIAVIGAFAVMVLPAMALHRAAAQRDDDLDS